MCGAYLRFRWCANVAEYHMDSTEFAECDNLLGKYSISNQYALKRTREKTNCRPEYKMAASNPPAHSVFYRQTSRLRSIAATTVINCLVS